MKKLFILSIAITASLLFVQCKKTEIISEEFSAIEKSMGNVLSSTSWEVLSVVSVPKNVAISWSAKTPKLNFFSDFIELKMGRDLCSKQFMLAGDDLIINYANSVVGNQNQQDLADLMEGRFKYLISDNGEEMILKNDLETEITLRRVVQLGTSTVVVNAPNNSSFQ